MSVITNRDDDGSGPKVTTVELGAHPDNAHDFHHALGETVTVTITGTVIERTNAAGGDKYWLEYPISHGRTARKWVDARDIVLGGANAEQ